MGKWRPVPGMTVQAGRRVPGTVWGKVMKVPKIMKLRKTNATGLKYSRQPRQVSVSTCSFIWTFETAFGESWENPKCIWDYKLLRLHFRPLCTGCTTEDEDRYCPILKNAQCWWLMRFSVKAEVVKYPQGPGKNRICWIIPHPVAQPGNFG